MIVVVRRRYSPTDYHAHGAQGLRHTPGASVTAGVEVGGWRLAELRAQVVRAVLPGQLVIQPLMPVAEIHDGDIPQPVRALGRLRGGLRPDRRQLRRSGPHGQARALLVVLRRAGPAVIEGHDAIGG